MSLILDHVNGIATDNRLVNLRMVCPNCAATLPTHCGRNIDMIEPRVCAICGAAFRPYFSRQRHCSKACGVRAPPTPGPRPHLRKTERPAIQRLTEDVLELGYVAVGRKYGVSDNAIRKWFRCEGVDPPRGTWPNRRRNGQPARDSSKPANAPSVPSSVSNKANISSAQPQSHARASSSSSVP